MLRRNWLVRLEYHSPTTDIWTTPSLPVPRANRVVMNEALQTQTLLVGFAYKLGPPSPLVAQH